MVVVVMVVGVVVGGGSGGSGVNMRRRRRRGEEGGVVRVVAGHGNAGERKEEYQETNLRVHSKDLYLLCLPWARLLLCFPAESAAPEAPPPPCFFLPCRAGPAADEVGVEL